MIPRQDDPRGIIDQPIETAPWDERVLIFNAHGDACMACRERARQGRAEHPFPFFGTFRDRRHATHWRWPPRLAGYGEE